MASGFQPLATSKRKLPLRCLTVFWMYFLIQLHMMLLYYQFYYSFSFIYFAILSFLCNIILVLIALAKLLYVIIYHLFWFCVTLLLTLDNVLFFISFLSHPFIRRCIVQSQFIHIFYSTFYAVFMCSYWLSVIQRYFIVLTIILMTYPW